jgi:hypothetical protein
VLGQRPFSFSWFVILGGRLPGHRVAFSFQPRRALLQFGQVGPPQSPIVIDDSSPTGEQEPKAG